MSNALFGPGGNGEWFKNDGGKSSIQAPGWAKKVGLDAYEYECGQGVTGSEEMFLAVGNKAREHQIAMSLHAPYFISLSGIEPEKRLKSLDYIEKSLWAANLLGADTIVIHSGSTAKISRQEAMDLSKDTLYRTAEKFQNATIRLGIETMGKVNQLGTLEEVIEQCKVSKIFTPVVDFGHLNARERGNVFPDCDSYRRIFNRIAEGLGDEHANHLHCHFSKIEFTDAGEKRHLTFEDTLYGPWFEPLAEAILKENVSPRIICESAGTQAEDALFMKNYYLKIKDDKK